VIEESIRASQRLRINPKGPKTEDVEGWIRSQWAKKQAKLPTEPSAEYV
jgi:hypothetical protein